MCFARHVLPEPDLAIIIATIDRAGLLYAAIESLVVQLVTGFGFEVVVVDNAPCAATQGLIAHFIDAGQPIRYVAEPRPGVSHARNTGVRATTAPIVAFMDDDQRADPDWVRTVHAAFADPDVSFVTGPVHPVWVDGKRPAWLSRETQGAASVIDRGEAPRPIDQTHWMCLPGGNMAVRREALDAVGGWQPYPRSQDRELTVRLLLAGYHGQYLPPMRMRHFVAGERMTRRYVRRWNAIEGQMRAGYQFEELFDASGRLRPPESPGRRLAGVPLFLYRRLISEGLGWVGAALTLRRARAFAHEVKARYFASYIRARISSQQSAASHQARTLTVDR